MDDKESKSPWDMLAQELGAQPVAEAFQRSQPPATEIPSSAPSGAAPPSQSSGSSGDWNALAGSLGLEITEPVAPDKKQTSDTAHERDAAFSDESVDIIDSTDAVDEELEGTPDTLPPLPNEIDQVMESDQGTEAVAGDETDTGIAGQAARDAFDALFTAGGTAWAIPSPEPINEKANQDLAEPESSCDPRALSTDLSSPEKETEEDGERPKRKRSRRRRRGRGGRKTEEEQSTNEVADRELDASVKQDQEELSEKDSPEEDDDAKPRRRRSRRRPRQSVASDDPTTDAKNDPTTDTKNVDTEGALVSEGEELSDELDASSQTRTGHRNLPTWSEAIGMIVDANLELRSKSPSKPHSSRGRGGRRRRKT